MTTEKRLWTEKETAAYLGVRRQTLTNWRNKKLNLCYVKLGKRVFYEPEEIENFIQKHRVHQ
jgi:predicted site-specific integrase-resolvase